MTETCGAIFHPLSIFMSLFNCELFIETILSYVNSNWILMNLLKLCFVFFSFNSIECPDPCYSFSSFFFYFWMLTFISFSFSIQSVEPLLELSHQYFFCVIVKLYSLTDIGAYYKNEEKGFSNQQCNCYQSYEPISQINWDRLALIL